MGDITTGGLDARSLDKAIRGLVKANRKIQPAAVKILQNNVKKMQRGAQARIGAGGYRMRKNKTMIGRTNFGTGASIKLNASRSPWAYQAEFGEAWANIPINLGRGRRGGTRFKPQSSYRPPTAGKLKQPTSSNPLKNRGGYMIQPTIRLMTPKLIKESEVKIAKLIEDSVKRG